MEIARSIIETLEDKKGENIVLLDIHDISSFADYFIICSATSTRMLTSLSEAVSETAKNQFALHSKIEGQSTDGWQVVDLGDIVVHLFSEDQRDYYQLEQLWENSKVLVRLQ